jgi:peptide methionine sulfoxide reductase msrA/msrB
MAPSSLAKATFAGGCFWCVVAPFKALSGVKSVVVGFTGGHVPSPTYQDVVMGGTGHFESVQVSYDPAETSYEDILNIFWRQIDPTDSFGQFADKGAHYRTAIFFHDAEQKRLAEASKKRFDKMGIFSGPIVTLILEASAFYPAEEYHQDYYQKNPFQYESYKKGSGRKRYVDHHPLENFEEI